MSVSLKKDPIKGNESIENCVIKVQNSIQCSDGVCVKENQRVIVYLSKSIGAVFLHLTIIGYLKF